MVKRGQDDMKAKKERTIRLKEWSKVGLAEILSMT